ncbi:hypothetical protein D9M68_578390 [compost metagenome]
MPVIEYRVFSPYCGLLIGHSFQHAGKAVNRLLVIFGMRNQVDGLRFSVKVFHSPARTVVSG